MMSLSAGCSLSFIGAFVSLFMGYIDFAFNLATCSMFCGSVLFLFVFGYLLKRKGG